MPTTWLSNAAKPTSLIYSNLEDEKGDDAAAIYQTLEQFGKLRDQDILTEQEFQAKKQELLSRL